MVRKVDMACFKQIILTRDLKGARVEAGRPKRGSGKSCWWLRLQW